MNKYVVLNRWLAFFHDLLMIPIVVSMAYWIRFNFESVPARYTSSIISFIIIGLLVQGPVYWFFGLYRGMWRFASIPDLLRIIKAVLAGAIIITVIFAVLNRLVGIPRSVLFLYPLLLIVGLSLSRVLYRWLKDRRLWLRDERGVRVVIVGAGMAGELLLRDLRNQADYYIVGFLDDDPVKQGRDIHGIPVLGVISEIEKVLAEYSVEEIIIAIHASSKVEMRRITDLCGRCDLPVRVLPVLQDMDDFRITSSQLRPLALEDLLGREQVTIDRRAIDAYIKGKIVMVTGAGGSIGSELCRQISVLQPGKLLLFEHSEFNLYAIDQELGGLFPDLELVVILGDVKNINQIEWVFRKFKPDVVFHAAAYKHVPMLELNPAAGVQNNIVGTRVLADAAARHNTEKLVFVSTDKAVNPANVMGTTKRIAEIYCQNLNKRCDTSFITTRFGNVLGSAGSVVPLFQKQIEQGGPITVTHPEIKRYFMTIPESVGLILQAGAMGEGGEIFVLDMGEPVLIKDMAEQMIRLSGLDPGCDIDIAYVGLRPGEKLYEELLHESEGLLNTDHPKLLLARSRKVEWDWLQSEIDILEDAAVSRDIDLIKKHLRKIVPEYSNGSQGVGGG